MKEVKVNEKRTDVIEEILKKLSFLSNQHLVEILERANKLFLTKTVIICN
ncbi:hypothetical protein [Niallia sp. Krafla_26]